MSKKSSLNSILFYALCLAPIFASDLTIDKAREILRTTVPNPIFIGAASAIKSQENLDREEVYNSQWAAILLLSTDPKSDSPDDVKLLIPYLGYGVNGAGMIKPFRQKISLDVIKQAFPGFVAILGNPVAKTVLSKYSTDTKNLRQYRILAFFVLRYVDPEEFRRITPLLNNSFAGTPPIIKYYLAAIENNQIDFWGDIPLEFNEK